MATVAIATATASALISKQLGPVLIIPLGVVAVASPAGSSAGAAPTSGQGFPAGHT